MTKLDSVDKLILRMDKLRGYLKSLKVFVGVSGDDLRNYEDKQHIVERRLELACESVLDICRLVVVDQRLPVPEKSGDYILSLGKAKIIDEEFSKDFCKIAGFRNILVHMYLDIDHDILAEKLKRLGDFERFMQEVANYYELKVKGE